MAHRTFFVLSSMLLVLTLTACSPSPSAAPTTVPQSTQSPSPTSVASPSPVANLANPASENCVTQGGTVSIQKNSDGSEYGLCIFPDGKQCEEWAMLRGECPVGGISVVGRYTTQLPAADAAGRVMELELLPDNTAKLTSQFIGKGASTIESGTWAQPGKDIVVTINPTAADYWTLIFTYDNGKLIQQNGSSTDSSEKISYTRTPSGNTHTAEFDGVKIAFDDQLAQSAQGEDVAAVPVTDGPALGGGSPAMVRLVFGDATAPDYLNPYLGQVLVYKTDEWEQLDSATAQSVANLKTLLATKPAEITGSIPVLPPIPAAQVFHVKPQYLDFKGGSGVGFVTYYSQAVNPITAKDLFYTFQGLTTDGQYYVVVYHPVTTSLLPEQADMDSTTYDEFAKNYEKFLADLVAQLNELSPSAYTPDLTLLDQLVTSIEIGSPTFSTSASAAGINPLSAEVCNGQAQAMSQALNGMAVTQSNELLFDPATGKQGTGCQATVTGTGEQFQGPVTVVQTLGALLIDQGFAEDMLLAADGPTGTAVGYRKGDQMCMAAAMWQPDDSANCPKDQPIAACELTPAQQLYTVSLNCGVEVP